MISTPRHGRGAAGWFTGLMDSYGELCAWFYDLDKPTAPELSFAWFAGALPRGRILEPMCGSGRFLVPLLQRGFNVEGCDPSPAMLARCREKLAAARLEARVWQAALAELEPADYDAVLIPASSFCLLHETAEAREGLKRLHGALKPGGKLLLEFEPPYGAGDWPGQVTRVVTKGGTQIRLVSRQNFDPASQIDTYENRYELRQSGRLVRTEDEVLRLRCYTPGQMEAALREAGFTEIAIEHQDFGWVARANR